LRGGAGSTSVALPSVGSEMIRALAVLLLMLPLASCLAGAAIGVTGRVIGTTVGVAGNVVEAGVKVTGAVVDAAIPDDNDDDEKDGDDDR
jgi:hypothetical protein